MTYMEKCVYGRTQIRFCFEWLRLKIRIVQQHLMKVCLIEFQQNLWNGVRGTWRNAFTLVCKLDLLVLQYGRKSELWRSVWSESPKSNFERMCTVVLALNS
jgi:hypothetical protein